MSAPTPVLNGKVVKRFFIFLILCAFVLGYGLVFLFTPTEHDARTGQIWLQRMGERVNCAAIFEKEGITYRDTTLSSRGVYVVIDIRLEQRCTKLPKPLAAYLEQAPIGALTIVRLWAGSDSEPCYTTWL